jgi:hypothetical protein
MKMEVKDVGVIAEKFAKRAGAASGDYATGVSTTQKDQAQLAIGAKDSYAAGVQNGIARGAFEKGLAKAGTAKWKKGVSTKGAPRYQTGVMGSKGDYQAGIEPYISTLKSLTLSPRGPKRSPQNITRVQEVVTAMNKVKESM